MKRAAALFIVIACVQCGCRTHMVAERDGARILIGDLPDIGFMPPVYVDDYCVVRFGFGPTAHGATGTFLLKKTAHSWEIIQKYLAYYA